MPKYKGAKIVAAIATFTTLAAQDVQAAIIGRGTVETNTGVYGILTEPDFVVEIAQLDPSGFDTLPGIPIFAKTISAADVGISYTVTTATNPNFSEITALLTDGVSDTIFFGVTGFPSGTGVATGVGESAFTFNNATDFQGAIIDSLTITIDSFAPDSPGQNPNGDGIWTDYSAKYSLSVQGRPVPEPDTSLGLGIAAGFGILFARKLKRSRTNNLTLS
ncbi:PEP-CTERM sorting domain-containing protein [Aliterella atlantica]|uniref:PEP-CTERM sorting domain-containing protein n=1 Tax=Aliterella atlantica TaxID=1827278 RepID=UPI000698031C|nr:PEP-CTERM sorting domain-containing protein [Aliterella atlantica]